MSSGSAPVGDPGAERDARRKAREASRGPRTDRPEVRNPSHRRRPVDARLVRGVAGTGIVAIAVAIAAFMSSHGSQGWLIGLVVSIVTLALAVAAVGASSS
jgi:hypothetical protein